jgi:integrase
MTQINEKIVAALPAPGVYKKGKKAGQQRDNELHYFSGATLQGKKAPSGFAVRVTAAGSKSFVRFYRIDGKPHLATLGRWAENAKGGDLTVLRAIIAAQEHAKAVRDGEDPRPERTRRIEDGNRPAGETVADLLDEFLARYVEKEAKLRSVKDIKAAFERLVKPAIGKLGVYELRRSHIVKMLDDIADNSGLVMSNRTLAYIRKAFNWRAARDDAFNPPIAKGMARKEQARTRILDNNELRAIWKTASEGQGPFPAFIKFLLLTAARLREGSNLAWDEIKGTDWTLPAARNKTKLDLVRPLSKAALAVLDAQQRHKGCRFAFTTDGRTPISGFTKFKKQFDQACGVTDWTPHDLRRTARSLMSRAGVSPDHAERCLGHVIGGVRGVYDRHEYHKEKKEAYEALASIIGQILNPTENVEQIAKHRKARR